VTDERKRFWTERLAAELDPGETIRALLLARRPQKITAGEAAVIALEVAAVADTSGPRGPTPDVGNPSQYVVVAATDRRVAAWMIRGEELVGRVADWPRERARLKLERGLTGSRIRAGHQQIWILSPFGGRAEGKALLEAAAA
jgi:hypothetical protein